MAIRNDQGIVLRSYPFGEADRVVVLLSPNRGKLRTVAKGVRKTTSRFGGRLEPFTHVDLVLYEGKNLDTITQVSIIEGFPRLRADLDRVVAAGSMVEAVDAVAQKTILLRLFLLLSGTCALDSGWGQLITSFLLKLAGVVGWRRLEAACGRQRTGHLLLLQRRSLSRRPGMKLRPGSPSTWRHSKRRVHRPAGGGAVAGL